MSLFSSRGAFLLVGMVVGLAASLVYTWQVAPVKIVNAYPALMRADYRRDWVRLAALSYAADGDLERARMRLTGFKHEEVANALAGLIEEYAAAGRSADVLRRLSFLAQTLGVYTPAMGIYLQTPGAPTPTLAAPAAPLLPETTPSPSVAPSLPATDGNTPIPSVLSPLPTPTPLTSLLPVTLPLSSRLQLVQQEPLCEAGRPPRVEVVVQDEAGAGVSGVEIWLMWPAGADRAVTGLKPWMGRGYADFDLQPGVEYMLSVSELGAPLVSGLRADPCQSQEGEGPALMSWRILLAPPPPAGAE